MLSRGEAVWPARLWLAFAGIYLVHLIDERSFGSGTAVWSTTHGGIDFTNEGWLAVNVVSFLLFAMASIATDRERLPTWVFVTLGSHLFLHSLMHVGGTLARPEPFPGVVSSVLLCLPFAFFVFARGARVLERRVWLASMALGLATMQPIYHFLWQRLGGGS